MDIIVAHPGKQHSYRLASALKKDGSLQYYVTTFYAKNSSKLISFIKKFLNEDDSKRLKTRNDKDLDDSEVVTFCKFGGLLEIFVNRFDKKRNFYRWLHRRVSDYFGMKTAKLAIYSHSDAIIAYDTNALKCFDYLIKQKSDIVKILDVSIVPRPVMKKIYDLEITQSGCEKLKEKNRNFWDRHLMNRFQKEIDFADYFLAPSEFVSKSLQECGADKKKIRIVPYGANVESNIIRRPIEAGALLQFLFVGNDFYRKGLPYLIKAMECFKDKAFLTITGSYDNKDPLVAKNMNKSYLRFTGLVTKERMQRIYEDADVFILPSFAEGMAQVGIEAMACGLPIICTTNSGLSDMITNGVNGFVIEAGNVENLKEKMQWFLDHKKEIVKMGEKARNVAKRYTWSRYEKKVAGAVHEIMSEKGK